MGFAYLLLAQRAGQPLRASCARNRANLDLGKTQQGVLRSIHHVTLRMLSEAFLCLENEETYRQGNLKSTPKLVRKSVSLSLV